MPVAARMRSSSSCRPSRVKLSSAENGSSISSTSGSTASARASATRWRWPPESWCGQRSARSPRPDERQHLARLGAGARRADSAAALEPEGDVGDHAPPRQQARILEHQRHRRAAARPRRRSRTVPALGCASPISTRSSVDLPTPGFADDGEELAARDREVEVRQDLRCACRRARRRGRGPRMVDDAARAASGPPPQEPALERRRRRCRSARRARPW